MKKLIFIFLVVATIGATTVGCSSLLPKSVEFFQKKVKPVPEKTEFAGELERRVALLAKQKTAQAEKAATAAEAPPSVVWPLGDAVILTDALSGSLGPPEQPHKGEVKPLVENLAHQEAKLRTKVERFADKQEPLVGKPIEGTGFFQIPYLLWIGIVFGVIFLVWTGLKVYGLFNPAVAVGVRSAQIGGRAISKGFSQLIVGTERFKDRLSQSRYSDELVEEILRMLKETQLSAQDADIQQVVLNLTRK